MKKLLVLGFFLGTITVSFAQIPTIDPTAIQRLIELRNTVSTLKKGLAIQKNTEHNTKGDVANTSALLEAETLIEDLLRDSDEYVKLAYASNNYSDVGDLVKFSKNVKGAFMGNLKKTNWKINALQGYLEGNNYNAASGDEFYSAFMRGVSQDDPSGTTTIQSYYENLTSMYERQYALQTALQKKKIQQAFTYYKMADELEKKAAAINEGMKSQTSGKAFTLKNKGAAGIGAMTGLGGLFDDLMSSDGISVPTFTGGPINVGGKNFVMDATGNVYDGSGNFVTKDLGFGAKEQAIQVWKEANPNLGKSVLDDVLQNPFGIIGKIFGAGSQTPNDYLDEIMKTRIETQAQNQAAEIQAEIYNNILKNATNGGSNYNSLLNSFSAFGTSGAKSGLRLTTGERISGNKIAIDLFQQAQELREKGDALLLEATQRTDEQKSMDAVWQKKMIRESLTKMTL
jgi:hypothetical protein